VHKLQDRFTNFNFLTYVILYMKEKP